MHVGKVDMRAATSLTAIAVLVVFAAPLRAVALDPPTVQPVSADRVSTTLSIKAGNSGAPGGFIVSFMRADDYRACGGWPEDGSALLGTIDCTFNGVPTLEDTPGVGSYCLEPGQTVEVVIGKLFDETGVVSDDTEELSDGTDYVFRARAAAVPGVDPSPYSPTCSHGTNPRTPTDCTVTQGFWKRHAANWSRVQSLKLGNVAYTNPQLESILLTPARGNGLIALAHELITARLNELLGAIPPTDVETVMERADVMIGNLIAPPVGCGSLRPGLVRSLVRALDAFNTGRRGPARCPRSMDIMSTQGPTWGSVKVRYR